MSSLVSKVYKSRNEWEWIIGFSIILLIVKLIILPSTQTQDADAVSRLLISQRWADNPSQITESMWLPLHFYLNGILIAITGSTIYTPKILNILLSVGMIFPFYIFVRDEISKKGAIYSAGILALCPIIFRNSFQALSGTPMLFFICWALYFISKGLQNNKWNNYLFAGICMTLACGFRYEAWVISAIFGAILLIRSGIKNTLIFSIFVSLMPIYWMIIGHVYHDDYLFGIRSDYNWNGDLYDHEINEAERIRMGVFFIYSWFLSFTPLLVWPLMTTGVLNVFKTKISWKKWLWLVPFLLVSILFCYKSFHGTLLMQHRFTAPLVLFSAPFIGIILNGKYKFWKKSYLASAILLMIPMTYFWNNVLWDKFATSEQTKTILRDMDLASHNEMLPIPKYDASFQIEIASILSRSEEKGFIQDFYGWSETYYWRLNKKGNLTQNFILPHYLGADNTIYDFKQYISAYPEGIYLNYCNSLAPHYFDITENVYTLKSDSSFKFEVDAFYYNHGINLCRYRLLNGNPASKDLTPLYCEQPGSVEAIKLSLYENGWQRRDIQRKAIDNRKTFAKALEDDAVYIYNMNQSNDQ